MPSLNSAPVADDLNDADFHRDGVGAAVDGARHHLVQKKRHLKQIKTIHWSQIDEWKSLKTVAG